MSIIKGITSIIHDLTGINTTNSTQALSVGKGKDIDDRLIVRENTFRNKGYLSKRQTVCTAPVSSGLPNFLTTGAATVSLQNISISAPLVITCAGGFDSEGAVDYIRVITTNDTNVWSAGSGTTTYYFYYDYDPNTEIWTADKTTLVPVYDQYAPSTPTSGQCWFDINRYMMFEYNGSSWVQKYRVFVGEAPYATTVWGPMIHYALNGRYEYTSLITVNDSKTIQHNIGVLGKNIRHEGTYDSVTGAVIGAATVGSSGWMFGKGQQNSSSNYYGTSIRFVDRNSASLSTPPNGIFYEIGFGATQNALFSNATANVIFERVF